MAIKNLYKVILFLILLGIEIEMQDGVFLPVLLQLGDGKSLEQLALALHICFDGGEQQRLAEAARTAQEVITSIISQAPYHGGLVDVGIAFATQTLKILYANGIFYHQFFQYTKPSTLNLNINNEFTKCGRDKHAPTTSETTN